MAIRHGDFRITLGRATNSASIHAHTLDNGIGATLADGALFAATNGDVGAVGEAALASGTGVFIGHNYYLFLRLSGVMRV